MTTDPIDDRLRVLEHYMASHEAAISAWWRQQWILNADVEQRMREAERFQNKLVGAVALASVVGSLIGGGMVSVLARIMMP